ncbi:hypothetical protein [Curtobacterium sp. BRB10]|uniref:hypothetical protein n=1 Tax=Curtobacterium sp. BRB10 TaxID=2962579 RepID=UPI0028826AFB|nr:hypothetical protein [Curtobacterium sp. BRB10]MDT0232206.1 hypothetical protein [Curtobacterium sp. BRB10]
MVARHGGTIGEISGDLAPDRARAVLESGERLAPKVVHDPSKVAAGATASQ